MTARPTLRRKLLRDIRRQWPQFVTLTLIITLGVTAFIIAFSAYRNLTASYAKLLATGSFADLWVTGGDVKGFVADAKNDSAVALAATRTHADLTITLAADKLPGLILGIPTAAVGQTKLLSGREPTAPGQVLVERHMADHFNLHPGDVLSIINQQGSRRLSITGVVFSTEYLLPSRGRQDVFPLPDNFGVLFAPDPIAADISGTADHQALVRLRDRHDVSALDRLRRTAYARHAFDVMDRQEQPSNFLIMLNISGLRSLAYMFPLLFLGVAALMAYVLLGRQVRAERPIIGLLTACGVPRRAVLWHYLQFGLVAGLCGDLVGVACGVFGARALTGIFVQVSGLPQSVAVVRFELVTLAIGVAFGAVIGLIAAAAPALKASRIPPAAAMRDAPTECGRLSIVERLFPVVRRLPVRWLLAVRNIGRNRLRTWCTIAGTALSLMLIMVSWLMIDSMNGGIRTQFDKVEVADARVSYSQPIDQGRVNRITSISGVIAAEPRVDMPVTLSHDGRAFSTELFGLRGDTKLHGFTLSDGTPTTLSDDGLLVGRGIHDRLGIVAGDRVTVTMPGTPPLVATVAGLLDERIGSFAYAPISWVDRAVGHPAKVSTALLQLDSHTDRDVIRRTVMDQSDVAFFEDVTALKHVIRSYATLFYVYIGSMLLLGVFMASGIVFTAMSVNIVERQREIAMLHCGGMQYSAIARLIIGENVLVTVMGVVLGLPLGVLTAQVFMRAYTNYQFDLPLVVEPATLAVSSLAVLLAAAASSWPGLRAVRKLGFATVVREQSR